MTEEISKAEAIERIKEADGALLITQNLEPIPTIGNVPTDEKKVKIKTDSYSIGEYSNLEDNGDSNIS